MQEFGAGIALIELGSDYTFPLQALKIGIACTLWNDWPLFTETWRLHLLENVRKIAIFFLNGP